MANIIPMLEDNATKVSGGEFAHGVTEVWGIEALTRGQRAHFWRRTISGYRRECDGAVIPAFLGNGQCPIFGAGDFHKCKRCMKRLTKHSPT